MTRSPAEAAIDEAAPRWHAMEHRWGHRIPCGSRVRLSTSATTGGAGKMRDVSTSGAFIETALPLPLFSRLVISVIRDDPRHEVDTMASVVRVARDGVGVEWCETPGGSICAAFGCTTHCGAASPTCGAHAGLFVIHS
jgi:hypothetical protein